ncbi:hypothetical protein CEK60_03965 [Halomonas sp. N3-2A]|nr:hypothetical protein CEK60_03965 [Halomonas sp. N3-2A]
MGPDKSVRHKLAYLKEEWHRFVTHGGIVKTFDGKKTPPMMKFISAPPLLRLSGQKHATPERSSAR